MRRRPARVAWLSGGAALVVAMAAVVVWRMPEVAAWQWYADAGKPAMTSVEPLLKTPLYWFDGYYAVADLGEGAYAIAEPRYAQCNFSYLIVGSRRALLFDSGPGLHDIRAVVARLTTLPILALPSHLHFDHVGNLSRFPDVALPDLPALRKQAKGNRLHLGFYQFLGFVEGFSRPQVSVSEWIAPDAQIDLGGRQLQMLSLPGHTPESVALLDRGANRLFAGDFIYASSIFAFLPGADLRDYLGSTRRVAQLINESSTVYGGHGCNKLPAVAVPALHRADVLALETSLATAAAHLWRVGSGWYPRVVPVNDQLELLATYPWMSQ